MISCENVRDKNVPRGGGPLGALILASLSRSAIPLDAAVENDNFLTPTNVSNESKKQLILRP